MWTPQLDERKVRFSQGQLWSQPQCFRAWVSDLDLQHVGILASVSSLLSHLSPLSSHMLVSLFWSSRIKKNKQLFFAAFHHLQGEKTIWRSENRQLDNRQKKTEGGVWGAESSGSYGKQRLCVCVFCKDAVGGGGVQAKTLSFVLGDLQWELTQPHPSRGAPCLWAKRLPLATQNPNALQVSPCGPLGEQPVIQTNARRPRSLWCGEAANWSVSTDIMWRCYKSHKSI